MFAMRRAIAQSFSLTLRVAPRSITRTRVTALPITQPRLFSQIRSRFAEEPVKEEPSAEEQTEIHEESISTSEVTGTSQADASTSSQAYAATSESTDQLPSGQTAADTPSDRSSVEQQSPATSQSAHQRDDRHSPKPTVFVGNLFFETTSQDVAQAFDEFGVTDVKMVTDDRGLSKGFAFVTLKSQEAAQEAINSLHQTVLMGRSMVVNHANRSVPGKRASPLGQNTPSKTLFIGNLSFQMSDRDLNDLFRDIKNVVDVRVAIDRRSGQPRGYAHADFISVDDADNARKFLGSKMIYGRPLKVDYAATTQMKRPV